VPRAAEQLINSKQLRTETGGPDKLPLLQHTHFSSAVPKYRFSRLGVRLLERFLLGTGTRKITTNLGLPFGLYTAVILKETNVDPKSKAKIKRF